VWGGERISAKYGRSGLPPVCAESWEIADRPDGMSIVSAGPLKGKTLHDLVAEMGESLLGRGRRDESFPLLIKIIDARECLSVQVHPDVAGAARHGGEAKTEMWYALDADPDARVFAGLKKGHTPEELLAAADNQTVQDLLQAVPVEKGSAVFIPGGRVHAIDAGCLLLEIQQNSNTTYRIYDWGRPRELHIEQAMKVICRDDDGDPRVDANDFQCEYFRFRKHGLSGEKKFRNDGRSFQILFVEEGPLRIAWDDGSDELFSGTSVLLPAALREWTISPAAGQGKMLQITLS